MCHVLVVNGDILIDAGNKTLLENDLMSIYVACLALICFVHSEIG